MGIMTFFGRMFGTEKAMNSAVDGLVNGLDALVYTEEERETDAREERKEARGMLIAWLDKSQGQHVARRFLAMCITFTWLSQYFLTAVFNVAAIWAGTPETRGQLTATGVIVGNNADGMTGAMMLILGFYFAAPHLAAIVEPAMRRFSGDGK